MTQRRLRAAVQTLTLLALRGLGVVDARARGLVVQTALPETDRYCSVATAIQSVTACSAWSRSSVLPCCS